MYLQGVFFEIEMVFLKKKTTCLLICAIKESPGGNPNYACRQLHQGGFKHYGQGQQFKGSG
jgi:hypothetical protein